MTDSKRALIIGGASGMGAAGARALTAAGWQVVVADRNDAHGPAGLAGTVRVDISSEDGVTDAVGNATRILGGLDAVWNHVGNCIVGSIDTMTLDDLDQSYAINVRANVLVTRAVLPHLRAAGGGSLLFSSSGAGVTINKGTLPYGVSKSALVTLTRTLALELAADNIRVNAICSGWVDTPFNAPSWEMMGGREEFLRRVPDLVPLHRMADPSEIGHTVAFVFSDAASFMTGQAITIDGGESLLKGSTR